MTRRRMRFRMNVGQKAQRGAAVASDRVTENSSTGAESAPDPESPVGQGVLRGTADFGGLPEKSPILRCLSADKQSGSPAPNRRGLGIHPGLAQAPCKLNNRSPIPIPIVRYS